MKLVVIIGNTYRKKTATRKYFSSICQDPELNNIHLDFNKTEIPEPAKNWITSNKFLLTMRNCRTHRLLFGTMWENSKRNLSDTTYGRFYSLLQYALKGLDCSYQEYQYHIDLIDFGTYRHFV